MRSPFRRWSLQSRLVLGVLLLTAVGFIFAGFVAQGALKSYLLQQVDSQLFTITDGVLPRVAASGIEIDEDDFNPEEQRGYGAQGRGRGPQSPLNRIPTTTSVTLLDSNGLLVADIGGDFNALSINTYLEGFTPDKAAAFEGLPFTIQTPGADFRAIAEVLPENAGTVVAAQSLGELDKTIGKLGFFFLLIGLLLLTLIAIASRIVIKVGMRPLVDVEVTAGRIAAGDLSARMPDANEKTEVGRLVISLNSMLSRIESSFAARTESEDRLRRFVADASHELRTPITAIRGFSELYRQGAVAEGEPTKDIIYRIEGESKRMGSLVEDLLLLARLDQAREMESKPVNLTDVVESAVISARVSGPHHHVAFNKPTEETFTLGDETRIHQVIANLLANARTHTPAGTKIDVAISRDNDGLRVAVKDDGPGLSVEAQKKIFERFYRADPSRVRVDGEGSGLGLSIVDAVMGAHGGSVSVESELGKGATFTLFFPLEK
jgi:two-component system OmpR family sensor kinase